MKLPFDELNMCDVEHVGWVKSQRDPELWHAAAIAIINTVGDPHGFLVWLADQPETDRATAGYFFLGVLGADYLRGQTEQLFATRSWSSSHFIIELLVVRATVIDSAAISSFNTASPSHRLTLRGETLRWD